MAPATAAVVRSSAQSMPRTPAIDAESLMRGCARFVVVAPHPDDEVLGVGGILSTLARTGTEILLVAVTEGEASHAHGDWWTQDRLRRSRPAESARALALLGCGSSTVERLRFPDGAVTGCEAALTERLRELLRATDCVATTWQYDGHPDHEATGRAVSAAILHSRCTSVQFPVWTRKRFLTGHLSPALHVRRFVLDAEARRKKRAALAAYRSQMRADPWSGAPPIVPVIMQRESLRSDEVLVL